MLKINGVTEQMLKELSKKGKFVSKKNLPLQKYLEEMVASIYTKS
tara:strand:- start:3628 stop:3762 length:135 start_codon:yes stop_codon:yes gene_type:complete